MIFAMEGSLWILIVSISSVLCELKCPSNDNCLCLSGSDYEYQCPENYVTEGGIVVHANERRPLEPSQILIDCNFTGNFKMELLPNFTMPKLEKLTLRQCPLPAHNFLGILKRFNATVLDTFTFTSSDLRNVVMTKTYFEGMEHLERLSLKGNNIRYLDEHLLYNTPNLKEFEIVYNNITTIPAKFFSRTLKLQSIEMSNNQLETLPDGLFLGLSELRMLHLWNNKLTVIEDTYFTGLSNLLSLELSLNKIESISQNAFTSLVNLKNISLFLNKLTVLPSDLFRLNKMLGLVKFNNNSGLEVPEFFFSNLPNLSEVNLSGCQIDKLPSNLFENSSRVSVLKLSQNRLENIPEEFFLGLDGLKKLYLDDNRIDNLTNLQSLTNLEILHLQHNRIRRITYGVLSDLTNLIEIRLERNQIEDIHEAAFHPKISLEVLDLSNNNYTVNESNSPFTNCLQLRKINLSNNHITDVEVVPIINKLFLEHIDFSYNPIKHLYVNNLQIVGAGKLIIDLSHNNISQVDFYLTEILAREQNIDIMSNHNVGSTQIILNGNPIRCDCSNYNLWRYYHDEMIPQVKVMFDILPTTCATPQEDSYQVEELNPLMLTCPSKNIGCPRNCSCLWRPRDKAFIVDCANKNLSVVPNLNISANWERFNHTEVLLQGNNILIGPGINQTGYSNVTKMNLSHNRIRNITWVPPKIEVLKLDHNEITHLDFQILKALNTSKTRDLELDYNPWRCDCQSKHFTKFLIENRWVNTSNIYCASSNRRLIDLSRYDVCREFPIVHIVMIVLSVLLFWSIFIALYYRYQREIKIWLFAKNLCLWWVSEEEVDKDKTYDAFISYSSLDESFIVDNLLPVLEAGPRPYKLCLHYRDWVPGEFISTQVANSVSNSRRTLVILSSNFLNSVWAKEEFRMAHTQAISEGRARVIMLLYGDVDVNSLDNELKAYLSTNTYIKWGDPFFWNKLRYALPHSQPTHIRNNQKLVNVISRIDDKLNLVPGILHFNPASTPPVLSMESHEKNSPLTFVSKSEIERAEIGSLVA